MLDNLSASNKLDLQNYPLLLSRLLEIKKSALKKALGAFQSEKSADEINI